MPRAALLSLHARIEGVRSTSWAHPSLAQLWGPRYSTYVVPKRDFAVFSVGRMPDERAHRIAAQARERLAGGPRTDRELGLGNAIRHGARTGTLAIRWEGARAPLVWGVDPPRIEPAAACRELAKRHLHVLGPTTSAGFARWAGVSRREAAAAYASLEGSLLPVRSPLGDEWLLAEDEPLITAAAEPPAPARLLPSGDAYFLLDGRERELLVPRAERRVQLWTPRVWPGALLIDGEIRGVWRRDAHIVRATAWERLSKAARDAVDAEARTLPLPNLDRPVQVVWEPAAP